MSDENFYYNKNKKLMVIKKTLFNMNQNINNISFKKLPLLSKDAFIGKFIIREKLNKKKRNKSLVELKFNNSPTKQKKSLLPRNNLSNSTNFNQECKTHRENSKNNNNLHYKEINFPNRSENIQINPTFLNKQKWSAKNYDLNSKKIYLKFLKGFPENSENYVKEKEMKINFDEIFEFLKNISKTDNFFGNTLFDLLLKKINNEDKLNNSNDNTIFKTVSSDLLKEVDNLFSKCFPDENSYYSHYRYKLQKFILIDVIKKIFKQLNKFAINQQNIIFSKEDIILEYDRQIKLLQNPLDNYKINKKNPVTDNNRYLINNKIMPYNEYHQKILPNEPLPNLYQSIHNEEKNKEINLQSIINNKQKFEQNLKKLKFINNYKNNNTIMEQIPIINCRNQKLDGTNKTTNKIKNAILISNYNNINTNIQTNTNVNDFTSLNNTTSRKPIKTNNVNRLPKSYSMINSHIFIMNNNFNLNYNTRRRNSKNFDIISELIDIPIKNNLSFDQKKYKNYISNLLISMSLKKYNNFKSNKKLNNTFIYSKNIKLNEEVTEAKNYSFDFGKNNKFSKLLLEEPELIKIFNGNLQFSNLKNLKNDIMNYADVMKKNFNLDVNIENNYYIQNIFKNYFPKTETKKKIFVRLNNNKKNYNSTDKILIKEKEDKNKSSNIFENFGNLSKNNEKKEEKIKEDSNKKLEKKEDEEENFDDQLTAFKRYIKKLKNMSGEEFDRETFKYLSKIK